MDTTFEPSFQDNLRAKITTIEFIELSLLAFAFWGLVAYIALYSGGNWTDQLLFLVITEILVLGSWALYNLYIRLARSLGPTLGRLLWLLAVLGTGSYTLWAWILLDVNRFLIARLFYRGETPVEYAWSYRSRQRRYAWEQARKLKTV